MPDLHDLLERSAAGYTPPPDLRVRVSERSRRRQRNRRVATGLAAVLVVAGIAGIASPLLAPPSPVVSGQPPGTFIGTWVSTDTDGSSQSMDISAAGDAYEVALNDDAATECSGTPATMTGMGRLEEFGLVVPTPALTCDNGTTPVLVDGTPLEDALLGYALVYDTESATLTDSFGVKWYRQDAVDDVDSAPDPATVLWPQSNLEEARAAQERADAGDPAYTWQVDGTLAGGDRRPSEAAIFARFLTEELGWEGFRCCEERSSGESMHWAADGIKDNDRFGPARSIEADFVRCAGETPNSMYPDDPDGRACAPTLADGGYERVRVTAHQPVADGPGGIWVIASSQPQPPFNQVVPLSDADIARGVGPFLEARVSGWGAEARVGSNPSDIPLLYATSDGARYERFDYQVVNGPVWPFGIVYLNVRLFAEGGETVVEQAFRLEEDQGTVVRPSPPHRLLSLTYVGADTPTTENGVPVPEPSDLFDLFDGRVAFSRADAWEDVLYGPHGPDAVGLYRDDEHDQLFVVVGDPSTPTGTCDVGEQPRSADGVVRNIQARPNLSVSEPRPTRVGSIDAVALDITAGDLGEGCVIPPDAPEQPEDGPAVLSPRTDKNHPDERLWWGVGRGDRARLYVFDVPGDPAHTVAILVLAPQGAFEGVLAAAEPLLESFELETDG